MPFIFLLIVIACYTGIVLLHCLLHDRYGGVIRRDNIADKADWYIYDVLQITDALQP